MSQELVKGERLCTLAQCLEDPQVDKDRLGDVLIKLEDGKYALLAMGKNYNTEIITFTINYEVMSKSPKSGQFDGFCNDHPFAIELDESSADV